MKYVSKNNFTSDIIYKRNNPYVNLDEQEKVVFKPYYDEPALQESTNYEIPKMEGAVNIIKKNLLKPIRCIGDYDSDGINSMLQISKILKAVGAKDFLCMSPTRESGYGASAEMVEHLNINEGLLILVDNGIVAFNAIDKAKSLGLDVLVLDHHLPLVENGVEILPNADIIINCHSVSTESDFVDYCAAGLCYKLAQYFNLPDELMKKLSCFAAIGTVGDMVNLIENNENFGKSYDNWLIVREGLKNINALGGKYHSVGLHCLLRALGKEENITESDISFKIVPTINAIGRLRSNGANFAYELLSLESDFNKGDRMAEEMVEVNKLRKDLTNLAVADVLSKVNLNDDAVVVVGDFPDGICGLIAGQISPSSMVPTIVLTINNGILHGSGRCPAGYELVTQGRTGILDKCKDLLLSYGGHECAAGLSLSAENLETFITRFKELSGNRKYNNNEFNYDFEITDSQIRTELECIYKYAPFGYGHPAPLYRVLFESKEGKWKVGEKMMSGCIREMSTGKKIFGKYADAVNFSDAPVCEDNKFYVYGTLGKNIWNGRESQQINYVDITPIV